MQAVPRTRRIAVLVNPDNPMLAQWFKATEKTTRASLKVELQKVEVRRSDEFERAFSTMAKNRVDAVVVAQDSIFNANVGRLRISRQRIGSPRPGPRNSRKRAARLATA